MQKIDLLSKTFSAQLSEKKRKSSVKWATLNLIGLAVITFDILLTDEFYIKSKTYFYYIEFAALIILSLSFLSNFFTFIYHSCFVDKIVCDNETQKILLNLSNNATVVNTPPPKPIKSSVNTNDSFSSIQNLSFQKYNEGETRLIEI